MTALSASMIDNYHQHPAFHFGLTAWKLPRQEFESFNESYRAARSMGSCVDGASYDAIRMDCESALTAVRLALRSQCADQYEGWFVDELFDQCDRLLREELAWYGKKRPQTHAGLSERKTRGDALLLQADRHYFGRLSEAAVAEMQAAAADDISRFRINAAAGKLSREDLSVNTGRAVAKIRSILNREFGAMGVLDTLSAYTGRKLRVVGLALELSVPQATWWRNAIKGLERAPETLYAHIDESINCPKSIVYLTDVNGENGPTSTYPHVYERMELTPLQEMIGRVVGYIGSSSASPLHDYYGKQYHQSVGAENFRRHFMRLPDELRFNSHMGWDVMPGTELERDMAAQERKMTGPAGTFVIFDGGRLMHRGGMVQHGERVALQVIFAEPDIMRRVVNKVKRMMS